MTLKFITPINPEITCFEDERGWFYVGSRLRWIYFVQSVNCPRISPRQAAERILDSLQDAAVAGLTGVGAEPRISARPAPFDMPSDSTVSFFPVDNEPIIIARSALPWTKSGDDQEPGQGEGLLRHPSGGWTRTVLSWQFRGTAMAAFERKTFVTAWFEAVDDHNNDRTIFERSTYLLRPSNDKRYPPMLGGIIYDLDDGTTVLRTPSGHFGTLDGSRRFAVVAEHRDPPAPH